MIAGELVWQVVGLDDDTNVGSADGWDDGVIIGASVGSKECVSLGSADEK